MKTRILLSFTVGLLANALFITAAYSQGATGVVKGQLVNPVA